MAQQTDMEAQYRDLDAGEPVKALTLRDDGGPPVGAILQSAIERGIPTEAMEKIVALYERMEDRAASQKFAEALATFQASCPPIAKTSTANIATTSGARYSYKYAELDAIARHIAPHLRECGLSYTWDSEMKDGYLVCTCTVRHARGHSQSAKFGCPTDTAAKMSAAQQNGAALTYARRQALIQALGLTTGEHDHDGDDKRDRTPITEHQAANINAMLDELKVDRARFGKYLREAVGVENVAEIPATSFQTVIQSLEAKRKAAR